MGEDGQFKRAYEPEETTILPGKNKKWNVPNSCYVAVDRYKNRSQHAFFSQVKTAVSYENVKKPGGQ